MRNILFVDDDQQVLEGLENGLLEHRREWSMTFVDDPVRALETLQERDFDVIVSDMRMPVMDGATLLRQVQQDHPRVVRIVLSAHADFEATLRAVPIAHHFLLKPCDTERLWEAVVRACGLQRLLNSDSLQRAIAGTRDLPVAPRCYVAMTQALAQPATGIAEIAGIVERDHGLALRVLKLANSAATGLRRPATNVQQAAVFLGTNMLRNLVLSIETFDAFGGGFSAELLAAEQRHATLTGAVGRRLLGSKYESESACLAGILHDLGTLVLATQMPAKYRAVMDGCRAGRERRAVEREVVGATHGQIGAWLLGSWGLPYPIVEAVACHDAPADARPRGFDVLGAIHVANALVHEQDGDQDELIDPDYLLRLGLGAKLDAWRGIAAELTATAAV